jgi:hypothetical protein
LTPALALGGAGAATGAAAVVGAAADGVAEEATRETPERPRVRGAAAAGVGVVVGGFDGGVAMVRLVVVDSSRLELGADNVL